MQRYSMFRDSRFSITRLSHLYTQANSCSTYAMALATHITAHFHNESEACTTLMSFVKRVLLWGIPLTGYSCLKCFYCPWSISDPHYGGAQLSVNGFARSRFLDDREL